MKISERGKGRRLHYQYTLIDDHVENMDSQLSRHIAVREMEIDQL